MENTHALFSQFEQHVNFEIVGTYRGLYQRPSALGLNNRWSLLFIVFRLHAFAMIDSCHERLTNQLTLLVSITLIVGAACCKYNSHELSALG